MFQALYSRLYISGLIFQVSYLMLYIHIHIAGLYSKFHRLGFIFQALYSFQILYSRLYISGFLLQEFHSKCKFQMIYDPLSHGLYSSASVSMRPRLARMFGSQLEAPSDTICVSEDQPSIHSSHSDCDDRNLRELQNLGVKEQSPRHRLEGTIVKTQTSSIVIGPAILPSSTNCDLVR